MAFPKESWEEARVLYETGTPPRLISDRLGMNTSQISRRAAAENWNRPFRSLNYTLPIVTETFEKVEEILEQASEENLLHDSRLEKTDATLVYNKACEVQLQILDTVIEAKRAISDFIKNHPNGTYIKKDSATSTSYGLVSEVLAPLASLLNATSIFTQEKNSINVTNNTQINQTTDAPIAPIAPLVIEFNGK